MKFWKEKLEWRDKKKIRKTLKKREGKLSKRCYLLLVLLSMPELSLKRTAHKTKTTPAEGFQNKSG